ncbi:MAG: hypothetical protein R3F49_16480 [Planctomycetota bacterium]
MNALLLRTASTLGRTVSSAALAAAIVVGSSATATAAVQVDKLAVKAGKVITLNGETIEDGVVVIEGGRITAVGKANEVQVPWDARVIDQPSLVAFPGFVEAHSSNGMDRPNESIDVAPFLNVRDSVDPVNFYFEECLRNGILTINVQQGNQTVIAGQGMVVRPFGMTVEEMLVKPNSGLKMSADPKSGKSRATQAQALRGAFSGLRAYLEEMVQRKKDGNDFDRRQALYQGRTLEGDAAKGKAMQGEGWKVAGFELVPRGEVDEKQEPLLRVVEGRLPVWFACDSPAEVHTALAIAKENGFLKTTTLVLGNSCWKAAAAIKEAGVAVVLEPNLTHMERDPVTNDEIETFVPKVYADHGITFALSSTGDSNRSLWYQAAQCVAHGMSRDAALATVTTTAANMLGLGERVGKLSAGMDGNLVLMSGDPLGMTTRVEHVIMRGEHVYDRSKDVRAKFLLEGVQPSGTAADDVESIDIHAEEAKAGQKEGGK